MKTLKSVNLKNFKGLNQVNIEITKPDYYIVGPNGSGKTTILQAIWLAIQGQYGFESKKKDRFRFIKPDEAGASTRVELFDTEIGKNVIIERKFTKSKETVEIRTEDGEYLDISYLEGLLDHFTYDIQRFARMSAVEQSKLFGIDTAEIDAELAQATRVQSDLNKKKLEMQAALRQRTDALLEAGKKSIPDLVGLDTEVKKVNTAELHAKIDEIYKHNELQLRREESITILQQEIDGLQQEIINKKKQLLEWTAPEALIDQSEIEREIERAEQINLFVAKRQEHQDFEAAVDAAKSDWEAAKAAAQALEEKRIALIRACKSQIEEKGIPADNIDFDDKGGLMIDGRYLSEDYYSTGELIRKAVIIINSFQRPEFPLFLIRNGSLLNRNADGEIEIFKDLEGLGAQFICEIVGTEPVKNGILLTEDLKK